MNMINHDSETLAHGQQVVTACAFIHQRIDGVEKVFLPKRAETKRFLPGVYELPGGHIDFGEEMEAGLAREIQEEFGMEVRIGDPFAAFTYVNDVKVSHSIEVVYFAQFIDLLDNLRLHPADHSTYGWFAEHELHHAATERKGLDDPVVKKGFCLLGAVQSPFRLVGVIQYCEALVPC